MSIIIQGHLHNNDFRNGYSNSASALAAAPCLALVDEVMAGPVQHTGSGNMDTRGMSTLAQLATIPAALHAVGKNVFLQFYSDGSYPFPTGGNYTTFLATLLSYISTNHFDGIWIDSEDYPAGMLTFVTDLSNAGVAVDLIVNAYGSPAYSLATCNKCRYVAVMAYDMYRSSGRGGNAYPHSGLSDSEAALAMWETVGVSPSKLILGTGWYGRSPTTSGSPAYYSIEYHDISNSLTQPATDEAQIGGIWYWWGGMNTQKAKMAWVMSPSNHPSTPYAGMFYEAWLSDKLGTSYSLLQGINDQRGSVTPPPSPFEHGTAKTGLIGITATQNGKSCTAELFLGPDSSTKTATSGPISFTSASLASVSAPITLPATPATYNVYVSIVCGTVTQVIQYGTVTVT